MARHLERRQKPAWLKLRRPLPPPTRVHSSRKDKKGYYRKDKSWKKEIEEELS